MVKITCQIEDYSNPSMPCIKVHNSWLTKRQVEIEWTESDTRWTVKN